MKSGIYSTSLTVLLPFLISQSVIAIDGTDIVGVENELAYPDIEDIDDTGLEKRRLSRFMRIGRGLSSFIRIGKNGVYAPVDGLYDDVDDYGNEEQGQGQINKGYANKRLSSFVRIGRGMGYPRENEKRAGAFIRVGKFPSSGYYRSRYNVNGNVSPYYRRTGRIGHSSFIRIGKRDTSNTLNDQKASNDLYDRYMDLERQYGEDDSDVTSKEKRLSRFVRIGRRPSSFVRIGRPSTDETGPDDDSFSYNDRLGDEEQKRMSKFVRIGKNKELLNDDVFKRRLSNFMRIGRQPYLNDIGSEAVKRRRLSSFVRIGRQPTLNEITDVDDMANGENVKRRMSSFVRIGKSLNPEEDIENVKRRMSSFVRIGKSLNPEEDIDNVKRRMSSFVRIGKSLNPEENIQDTGYGQDVKRRMSSFVRIGKSVNTEGKANGLDLETEMKDQNESGLQ